MEEPTTPEAHSTPTSLYHESDTEFLRASAREWLEAVLGENLDKQTSLEDLLADGTLLFRVSQHIREDSKFPGHAETATLPVTASPSFDKKSSLKYQPYASVEAFLKVCKEVGLRDADIFNPSDAVDKKDIRRVCVCLRRLSKKGRSIHILVPDFDNVKDTLITPASLMPREAVQKTKETLQQSASRSSPRSSENGMVSNETSSSIADLRKDDVEESESSPEAESVIPKSEIIDPDSANLEADVKAESYNKVHHDQDVESVATDSNLSIKVAEPILPSAPDDSHRNGAKPASDSSKLVSESPRFVSDSLKGASDSPKAASDAPAALKPTMSRIMLKPPGEPRPPPPPVEEKSLPKASEEIQKGLFRAHLQGKAPYTVKKAKDSKEEDDGPDDGLPWLLPVLGGAAVIVTGIFGLILWKKRSESDTHVSQRRGIRGFIASGKKKLKKLKGNGNSSSDSSSSDSESDDGEGAKFFAGGEYEVKEGDNLTKIAKNSGKKHWHEIVEKNPNVIDNPDLIYPGDRLKL